MFNREDYYPYMFGVFVFAGLMAVPAIWGQFMELPLYRLMGGSMVGCVIFAQAHTRTGEFLFGRFVIGVVVGTLITLKASMTADAYLAGGLLGFVIMSGGGWLGIWLGRFTGITAAFETADSTVLQTYDATTTAAPAPEGEVFAETPDEQYLFSDTDHRALLENSRQSWIRGDLSDVSANFSEEASVMSREEFSKRFDSYGLEARQVFDFAFNHTAPLDDEIVVAAENGGVQLSYLLTDKYLYFFGLDDRLSSNNFESGKLSLGSIQECRLVKEGWVYDQIEISLRSGKVFPMKFSSSRFPVDYLTRLIDENG